MLRDEMSEVTMRQENCSQREKKGNFFAVYTVPCIKSLPIKTF